LDCKGAYIEVERENNGFEARWCGNRVTKVCIKEFLKTKSADLSKLCIAK